MTCKDIEAANFCRIHKSSCVPRAPDLDATISMEWKRLCADGSITALWLEVRPLWYVWLYHFIKYAHKSYHIWRLCFCAYYCQKYLPHSQIDMSTFGETWSLRFLDFCLLCIVHIHQILPDYPFCTYSNLMVCFWLRLHMNREKAVQYSSSQSGMFVR